jgi:hypothetical protein
MKPCSKKGASVFSKKDFDDLNKTKKTNLKHHDRVTLEEITRAAPQMEVLTGSEEWDKYLTYLQALLETIKYNIEQAQHTMLDPFSWNTETLTKCKMDLLKLEDRKDLLEFVMKLPKELIETGEIAKHQLYEVQLEEQSS